MTFPEPMYGVRPVQHREVGRHMRDVERGRTPRGLHPVDHPGDLAPRPQEIADVEVTMQKAPGIRRWLLVQHRERPTPEPRRTLTTPVRPASTPAPSSRIRAAATV